MDENVSHPLLMGYSYMLPCTPIIIKPFQTEMTLSLLILTVNFFKMSSGRRPESEFFLTEQASPSVVHSVQAQIILNSQV